ncbi:MAG: CapA family protein [bacterium]|nr:CapA family protein [bacterium]
MSKSRLKLGLQTILVMFIGVTVVTLTSLTFQNIKYQKVPEISNTNTELEKSSEEPKIKELDFVILSFLGDIMLDRGVENSVIKNFGGDFSKLFVNLEELKNSDIFFANLEGTASDKGKNVGSIYSFHMDPSVVPVLKNAGVDILSVANNHIGDWGLSSYKDTLSRLRENEILYTGGGENSLEAEQPTVIEKNGIKIGFLGFADNGPGGMEATPERTGFLSAKNPRFAEIVKNASEQVDYLIVSFHFGEEYQTIHNARQEYLAHTAIDNGSKIVIGHHPHVIEDTEVYSPKDCTQSSCVGYIAYSLGNFIFDQWFSTKTMEGLWLEIKLEKNGNMTTQKNIVKLNKIFQPDTIIKGKEEKIGF